jgi:hypothetical protein
MSSTLELGDVFFFYRPRVGTTEVRTLDDVQRFFVLLAPDARPRVRRLVVGRKRLPDTTRHEREWAFVSDVTDDPEPIREELGPRRYETRTRGVRVEREARAVGEGRYAIVDHDGHSHWAYVLDLPHEPGDAQRTFRIEREASYVVAVRNPDAPTPPGVGLRPSQRPEYPPQLRERFDGRRFAPLTPELLDYPGTEVVLIGASEDVDRELGIQLDPDDERLETADLFRRLRIRPEDLPVEPLDRGELR